MTAEDRQRWRAQVVSAQAGSSCGCGTCPSIEIEDGPVPSGSDCVVLTASHPDATLLLFIDGDQFSCLELAPHGDDAFSEFPPVADLTV